MCEDLGFSHYKGLICDFGKTLVIPRRNGLVASESFKKNKLRLFLETLLSDDEFIRCIGDIHSSCCEYDNTSGNTSLDYKGFVTLCLKLSEGELTTSTLNSSTFSSEGVLNNTYSPSDYFEHLVYSALKIIKTDIARSVLKGFCSEAVKKLYCTEWALVENAIETLNLFDDLGFKLALCTNSSEKEKQRALIKHTLKCMVNKLNPIILSGEIGLKKPDPRTMTAILDVWEDIPSLQVLVVGDLLCKDILAAQSIQATGIWFPAHAVDKKDISENEYFLNLIILARKQSLYCTLESENSNDNQNDYNVYTKMDSHIAEINSYHHHHQYKNNNDNNNDNNLFHNNSNDSLKTSYCCFCLKDNKIDCKSKLSVCNRTLPSYVDFRIANLRQLLPLVRVIDHLISSTSKIFPLTLESIFTQLSKPEKPILPLTRPLIVTYLLSYKKSLSIHSTGCFNSACDVIFIPLFPHMSLVKQTKSLSITPDVFMFKATFALSQPKVFSTLLSEIEILVARNPPATLCADSLHAQAQTIDRECFLRLLHSSCLEIVQGYVNVRIVRFWTIKGVDVKMAGSISSNDLIPKTSYPLIVKRRLAAGDPSSHDMAMAYSEKGLRIFTENAKLHQQSSDNEQFPKNNDNNTHYTQIAKLPIERQNVYIFSSNLSIPLTEPSPASVIESHLIVEEYVKHGGIVFKIYVLGNHIYVCSRASIPRLEVARTPQGGVDRSFEISPKAVAMVKGRLDEENDLLYFNSNFVKSPKTRRKDEMPNGGTPLGSSSSSPILPIKENPFDLLSNSFILPNNKETNDNDNLTPNYLDACHSECPSFISGSVSCEYCYCPSNGIVIHPPTITALASTISRNLRCKMFGFDLVVEEDTGDYVLLDLNHFPGYGGMPNLGAKMREFIRDLVAENGFFPIPPIL